MKTLNLIVLSILLGGLFSNADGAVAITNGSFETGTSADAQDVPDWFDYTSNLGDLAKYELANPAIPLTSAGTHWLNIVDNSTFSHSTGVYQEIGTHDLGVISYDVSMLLGDRADALFTDLDLVLYQGVGGSNNTDPLTAGLTVVDSVNIPALDGGGGSTTQAVTLNLDASSLISGETLWLAFESNDTGFGFTRQALIDNVSIAAVPEPSSWLMLVVGVTGVFFLRKRRALS